MIDPTTLSAETLTFLAHQRETRAERHAAWLAKVEGMNLKNDGGQKFFQRYAVCTQAGGYEEFSKFDSLDDAILEADKLAAADWGTEYMVRDMHERALILHSAGRIESEDGE